jgi:purine-nucleoside phosphorylase
VEALGRVTAWRPHAAAVYGSGLWALPEGARVADEVPYDALGWPAGAVPGHHNVLRLAALPVAGGRELRLVLACGRPHRYEGWTDAELERPVRDLASAGVRRLVLTNSCGALRPRAGVGRALVCSAVVDLQRPPASEEPERLELCAAEDAERVAAALGDEATPGAGVYVAVAGPQFETPAEVAWLGGYGDVVGMSAAPEVRAAAATGVECCLLALVANVAAAAGSHDDVLAAGARLGRLLAAGLPRALQARWPDLLDSL